MHRPSCIKNSVSFIPLVRREPFAFLDVQYFGILRIPAFCGGSVSSSSQRLRIFIYPVFGKKDLGFASEGGVDECVDTSSACDPV